MKLLFYRFKTGLLCTAVCFLCSVTGHCQDQSSASSLEKITAYLLEHDYQKTTPALTVDMLAGDPIYQINAGGWDAPAGWGRDTKNHPSPYVTAPYFKRHSGIDWMSFYMKESRMGNMQWGFPVTNGGYVVTLYFVEGSVFDIGERVFDVEIEEKDALIDFDIANFAGQEFPVALNFFVNVADNNLNIDFTDHDMDRALVSAIVVRPSLMTNLDPILYQTSETLVKTMKEGTELRIPIRATDFDSPSSAIKIYGSSIGQSPRVMRVFDHGDGAGEVLIQPGYDDAGQYSLIIAAEDEDGIDTGCDACWALVELTIEDTPEGSALYRVNAGDWRAVEAPLLDWSVDSYKNPSPFLLYSTSGFQTHNIQSNSTDAPDDVFAKSRVATDGSNMFWEFPVLSGYYTVNLYFVESHFDAANSRVFDVFVEGSRFDDIDIFSEVGKNVPLKKSVTTRVRYNDISITFRREYYKANPLITAIEIIYEGETAPEATMEATPESSEVNHDLTRKVSIYPNPIEDQLTLTLPNEVKGPIAVRLIDSDNNTIYRAIDNNGGSRAGATFFIDQKLPSGIYTAEVIAGNSREYIHILKK